MSGLVSVPRLGEGAELGSRDRRDLQGADDPANVPRLDPSGRDGIALGEAPVELLGPELVRLGLEGGADRLVFRREDEAVDHSAEVQAAAPDEERARRGAQRAPRLPLVPGDGEPFARIDEVQQMVPHAGPLIGRRLGRADIHPAIHEHRVHGYDVGAERLREGDPGFALAARRRTDQGEQHQTAASSGAGATSPTR